MVGGQEKKGDSELKFIEKELYQISDKVGGVMNQIDKELLVRLEGRRNSMLLEREESRAIWLDCGDDNTKKFMLMPKGERKQIHFGA